MNQNQEPNNNADGTNNPATASHDIAQTITQPIKETYEQRIAREKQETRDNRARMRSLLAAGGFTPEPENPDAEGWIATIRATHQNHEGATFYKADHPSRFGGDGFSRTVGPFFTVAELEHSVYTAIDQGARDIHIMIREEESK